MPNTEEQRHDLIENCNYLLENVLQTFDQTDDTPEGRMITQLKWLKERAENHDLPLPVERGNLSTLLYVYTNGDISCNASSSEASYKEIDIYMRRLVTITRNGNLLIKPEYKTYLFRTIDLLLERLTKHVISENEVVKDFIRDIKKLRRLLEGDHLFFPLVSYMPDYESFIDVDEILEKFPSIFRFYVIVRDYIFNGVRPDEWLTTKAAEDYFKGIELEN